MAATPPATRSSQLSGRLTVVAIALMFLVAAGGYVRGVFFAHPAVPLHMLDAGPERAFAIGKVVVFPADNVYLIGMEDGHIRAVDGVVANDRCVVQWLPDDPRGAAKNPRQVAGVLVDPCSQAVWAASGDALAGTNQPLRTFEVTGLDAPDGRHVQVEVLGDRHPPRTAERGAGSRYSLSGAALAAGMHMVRSL